MVTEMGDQFLLVKDSVEEDDKNKCLLCFMSPLQKELGRLAKKWFCDGTFKPRPYPLSGKGSKGQVYTLFAELDTGVVIPFAFCLLPDKLAVTYCCMWSAVHQALTNDGQILLRLECVGIDFEVAPSSEFEALFPGVLVMGCFIHWHQAVNRNLATKECTNFFNENIHFQDIVAMCIGLAFVPLDQIIEFTMLIEQEWDKFEEEMCDEATDWITYFMRTYVGEINARTGRQKSQNLPIRPAQSTGKSLLGNQQLPIMRKHGIGPMASDLTQTPLSGVALIHLSLRKLWLSESSEKRQWGFAANLMLPMRAHPARSTNKTKMLA
jgi:hypothetical protein